MKATHKEINPWTLKFKNAELETTYQQVKMSFKDLPLVGRIAVMVTLTLAIGRRLMLLFDSLYGTQVYDSNGEIRLTLEFMIGVALEFPFAFFKPLGSFRGAGISVGGFLSLIDSSCFYYPAEPCLVTM